jgi:hypothetical protein
MSHLAAIITLALFAAGVTYLVVLVDFWELRSAFGHP